MAQMIEMTARDLRMLADVMGIADSVVVAVDERIAREYWHKLAQTPVVAGYGPDPES